MRQWVAAIAAVAVAIALLALIGAGNILLYAAPDETILKSVPLLLTGLAIVVAFRAGVWNIGGEGQFLVGALAAFVAARFGVVASLLAAALAGAAWASIASLLRWWRNAPEVLTTILLNFIAINLLGWCVNGPLQEASAKYPQSDAVSVSLPMLGDVHAGVIVAAAVCVAVWWMLYRTAEGLRLRATGFNPFAARFAGVKVGAQIFRAMAISGACAGLAGGIELLGVTHRLFERFAAGYGYAGIAVALLAQLHPLATLVSALFFGALATGAGELQRSANISATVATLGQAVVILTLILFGSWRLKEAAHD